MEEVRTNASKANKIITQALSGKITLESLTAPPTSPGGRSKSASVRRLKNTTSADSLGLAGGRTSKSAGDNTEDFNGGGMSGGLMYSLPQGNQSPPKPYKSPYEVDVAPID
mmetsp:Transcript_31454/g.45272  ORF Transcript_31454/g.45272 Transcript_31454/m.45272 type:complete len:111 (-) Transcript_31454:109-441(-)